MKDLLQKWITWHESEKECNCHAQEDFESKTTQHNESCPKGSYMKTDIGRFLFWLIEEETKGNN